MHGFGFTVDTSNVILSASELWIECDLAYMLHCCLNKPHKGLNRSKIPVVSM